MIDLTKKWKKSNFKRDCKRKGLNYEDYLETPCGRSGEGPGSYALFTYTDKSKGAILEIKGTEEKPGETIILPGLSVEEATKMVIAGKEVKPSEEPVAKPKKKTEPKTPKTPKKPTKAKLDTPKPKTKRFPTAGLTQGTIKTIEKVLDDTPDGIVKKAILDIKEGKTVPSTRKAKNEGMEFYEENSVCRSDFKKTCKKNGYLFEDFEESKDGYYERPSGLRDMRYFYKLKVNK